MNTLKLFILSLFLVCNLSFSKVIVFDKPSNSNEVENLLINNKIGIIEFYLNTCKPCLKMGKILEKVSNEIEIDIIKLNGRIYNNVA